MLMLWMDMITLYVRLYYFLAFIPEKSTIIALYAGAAHFREPDKPVRYVNE
jgi:hypothetical protein